MGELLQLVDENEFVGKSGYQVSFLLMQYVDAFQQNIDAFSRAYATAFIASNVTPEEAIKACLTYFLRYPNAADQ